jgi:hypothetical protein
MPASYHEREGATTADTRRLLPEAAMRSAAEALSLNVLAIDQITPADKPRL